MVTGKIEHKKTDAKVLDIDESSKKVVVAIASLGDVDRDNDIFQEGCFDRTIRERGPNGSNEIWHLLDHEDSIREGALGKPSEMYVKDNKLVFVSEYRNTFNWREIAWPLYVAGDINQHSAGFTTLKARWQDESQKVRIIEEVSLWEGSCVLWGANPNTPTQDVIKSWIDGKKKKLSIPDRLLKISKSIKNGDFAGDNHSLLELELKYVENIFHEMQEKAKQIGGNPNATTEQDKKMLEIFAEINNKLVGA